MKRKTHDPYTLPGRWYKTFLESDGSAVKVTTSDLEVDITGTGIKFPKGFHIVDVKFDINSIEHGAMVTMAQDLYGYADGSQGVYRPVANAFDWANVYVFGYFA